MAEVVLENLNKAYGNVVACRDVNLTVKDREFMVLVGPSGCGKSTSLRMLAGLEDMSSGEIRIDGKVVNDVQPKDRDIAMVFQSYALYPHMSVYENMAFSLKLRKFPKDEIHRRVNDAANLLGISRFLERKPKELSGGECQRVAVGRAIVRNPKVFLFDEPLSNLDAKLRVAMRNELKKIHAQLQATIVYVTHDQLEAMTMGDRIAVMKDGAILQIADPITIYEKPVNKFVASFIGTPAMNFMEGTLVEKKGGVYFDEEHFQVRLDEGSYEKLKPHVGKEVILGVRPEDITDKLYAMNVTPDNVFTATVELMEPLGSHYYLYCSTGKSPFIANVGTQTQVEVNQDIEFAINTDKLHIFERDEAGVNGRLN
jgi:multiple sugar transport system ATP-binding protein